MKAMVIGAGALILFVLMITTGTDSTTCPSIVSSTVVGSPVPGQAVADSLGRKSIDIACMNPGVAIGPTPLSPGVYLNLPSATVPPAPSAHHGTGIDYKLIAFCLGGGFGLYFFFSRGGLGRSWRIFRAGTRLK